MNQFISRTSVSVGSHRSLVFCCTILFPMFLAGCVSLATSSNTSIDQTNVSRAGPYLGDSSISMLGITARSGLKAPLNMNLMVSDLLSEMANRPDLVILPQNKVRGLLSAGAHDDMLAHYARNGRLAGYQIRVLTDSMLPTRRALLIRLEDDKTQRLPIKREPVLDEAGQKITSRKMTIYATRRTTTMSATIVDLTSGRVSWTRQLSTDPETSNIVVGPKEPMLSAEKSHYPTPPLLSESVRTLIEKLVSQIP